MHQAAWCLARVQGMHTEYLRSNGPSEPWRPGPAIATLATLRIRWHCRARNTSSVLAVLPPCSPANGCLLSAQAFNSALESKDAIPLTQP